MAYETKDVSQNIRKIYAWPAEKPKERRLVFKINKKKQEVTYYLPTDSPIKRIYIRGFSRLPKEFSPHGYIKQGLVYYLSKMLADKEVKEVILATDAENQFKKVGKAYTVTLSYDSFKWLKGKIAQINSEAKFEKSKLVDEFFHELFPSQYPMVALSSRRRASRVIQNLDASIIEHLSRQDVEKVLNFFQTFLSQKYTSATHKRKLFTVAKIKVDDLTLNDIICRFEALLSEDPSESKWGDFLRKNLFLIDTKYVNALPQLNVMLGTTRKMDFGLLDSQGYLDIFEIKKPSTSLLASTTDRGNHYWSTDAVKAIVQAEKYLFNAERKASSLKEDLEREKSIEVELVKPRAFVIMGSRKQLEDKNRMDDFRVLQGSLKNVEILLYDDLLLRLKNQKNKMYVE